MAAGAVVKLTEPQRYALEAIRDERVLHYGHGRCVTLGYRCRRVRSNVVMRLVEERLAVVRPIDKQVLLTGAGLAALAATS